MKEHKEVVTNIMENVKNEMLLRLESEYQRGYEDGKKSQEKVRNDDIGYGYQRGLEDAWEWARKIMIYEYPYGISIEQFHKIFDTVNRAYVLKHLTAREVMQKIKDYNDYEERQTEDKWQTLEGNIKKAIEPFKISDVEQVLEQMRKESE